jgi:glycosyltransferase involved in cell wall biosynthesis
MLVSERADATLREQVRLGIRPCPEYLRLEQQHGVTLLDWSVLADGASRRSARLSLSHVRAALAVLDDYQAVLSDGEHVGLPLALGMRARGRSHPHVVICHHLTTRPKPLLFRTLRPHRRMSRLLLHSRRQMDLAAGQLRIPPSQLHFQPYGVDDSFWRPGSRSEESLVVSAGREHRDYQTLARAVHGMDVSVFVAAGSLHSPRAHQAGSSIWPPNISAAFADHRTLRDWYERAAVVVVPLLPNDFQAGVTTLLEAMAMGKAVVSTATEGQRDVVEPGVTGLTVPPGDSKALRETIESLLASPSERRRLGANARDAVEGRFTVDAYAASLAGHVEAAMTGTGSGGTRDTGGQPASPARSTGKEGEQGNAAHLA